MSGFADFLKNSSKYTIKAQAEQEAPTEYARRVTPSFYINRMPLSSSLPQETQRWIRNESDERAAIEFGCRVDERRGQYSIDWVEENCVLYEGDLFAGEHVRLEDWQYECYMQSFGWQWFDEEWEARKAGYGWVRRFKTLSGWVPKKNGKSPTLATLGLFLFLGDGEPGQKCYSLATTREQALISHTHAINFIKQSPTLSARCKIDATSSEIYDPWTKSFYRIICGDKGSHKYSKEGLNGSLVIDETHVVDGSFMSVISRAGISRRQPLVVQLSTAGDNTAGYGYQQYLFGKENLRAAEEGKIFDYRYHHFEYGVPQDTSIDDLRDETKIDGLIRLANPTLGRIVRFNEAKDDWRKSVRSDTELAIFAKYRLNQWMTGSGAFIAGADWDRCGRGFKLSEVEDYPCVIGVDMSRSRDMTCCVTMWAVPKIVKAPEDIFDPDSKLVDMEINVPYIIPYFWAPKRGLSQFTGKLDALALQSRKQLFITQEPIVRVETLAAHINRIDERFDCRGVASDSYYSAKLSGALSGLHSWEIEGENSRYFTISQNASAISPAIDQLIGCTLSQELVHNNNEVLRWQLGNVTVVENKAGDKLLQKPTSNDWRKIDGWAAITNGIFYMMTDPDMYPGRVFSISL